MSGKWKKYLSILVAALMIFAFAGCGSDNEPAEEQPEEQVEEQAPETTESQSEEQTPETTEADDYDIAANLMLAGGGAEKAIDTDHFTISLTHGSSWDYEVDSNTSITIYNVASREADCGGRLVSILAYDAGDKSYEILPSYCVIGEKDGKVYIAEYPTDVQFDFNDEQATADYQAVYEEVNKIRDGGDESPLVLK